MKHSLAGCTTGQRGRVEAVRWAEKAEPVIPALSNSLRIGAFCFLFFPGMELLVTRIPKQYLTLQGRGVLRTETCAPTPSKFVC